LGLCNPSFARRRNEEGKGRERSTLPTQLFLEVQGMTVVGWLPNLVGYYISVGSISIIHFRSH
jgi:hypothetical protein